MEGQTETTVLKFERANMGNRGRPFLRLFSFQCTVKEGGTAAGIAVGRVEGKRGVPLGRFR